MFIRLKFKIYFFVFLNLLVNELQIEKQNITTVYEVHVIQE